MKGLEKIPQIEDLRRAYDQFLLGQVSQKDLAQFSQWTRFDPRLGEIWVDWVGKNWQGINPVDFHFQMLQTSWPSVSGVLLEFVEKKVQKEFLQVFRAWKSTVTLGFKKADFEQYFIGLRSIGGRLMVDDARFSLAEYKKWGFLSREVLFNKSIEAQFSTHSFDQKTRIELLKSFLETHSKVTTLEYWNLIHQCVSFRQTERDLKSCSFLKGYGNTKGRYYKKVRKFT